MTIFATSSLRVSAKYLLVASSDLFISGAGMPSSYVRLSASSPVARCLWGRWSVRQQKVSVAGRKARFRSRKKTYYGVRRDIFNKIPKSWSNRNVVVRVCGGVARGSCVLIEASSITTRRYDISTVLFKLLHARYRGNLHLRRVARRGQDAKGLRKCLSNL